MLQVRKLVLAVAAATAFSSGFAHALGLGELAVKSSLNQPLDAEISLLEVRDLSAVEIKAQLASPEAFSKAGIDRQFFLTTLHMTPVLAANGKSVIRVTSTKPVNEPYLSFLVELIWPSGRLLREYTLLIDPPLYKPQPVIYAAQPAITTASNAVQPPANQFSQQPRTLSSAPQVAMPTSAAPLSDAYRVRQDDTLWRIAQRVAGQASVQQAMLAIQDLNPRAFLGGNINRMKSGQVLQLPTATDINRRSRAEAVAQVNQQSADWKTAATAPRLVERQLDATSREEVQMPPAQVAPVDNLTLVADGSGQGLQAADQGAATDLRTLQEQLATSKDRLDSTVLEYQDLKERVEDLHSQLDKLQHLIELKDNLLAHMQNGGDLAVTPVPDTLQTLDSAAPVEAAAVALTNSQEQAEPSLDEPILTTELAAPVQLEPSLSPSPPAETPLSTANSQVQAAESERSTFDRITNSPMLLAVGGVAVLSLLLLLMAVSRSKARKEAELSDEAFEDALPEEETDSRAALGSVSFLAASNLIDVEESRDFDTDFAFNESVDSPQFKQEATDPIAEANSYMNFARFTQAAEVLNKAIVAEPQRMDLRLKLLDALAGSEDQAGFANQVSAIIVLGGAGAALEQVKARYPQMMMAEPLSSVATEHHLAESDANDVVLDTPIDLSPVAEAELDADLEHLSSVLVEPESAELGVSDTAAVDEFDFDLDLPGLHEPVVEATQQTAEKLSEKDFELDLDAFDFALDSPQQDAEIPGMDDAMSLDELSVYLADSAATAAPDFALPDDFDLVASALEPSLDADLTAPLDNQAELDAFSASLKKPSSAPATALNKDLTEALQANSIPELELGELGELASIDDDYSFLSGADEVTSKLDLARAYVEMGDTQSARRILDEVLIQGTVAQQDDARELISQLG